MTGSAALNAARRAVELTALADIDRVDLLVVGGGVTGTGIALDAAARGLSVALVEKRDLAFGTSRWSSKLVHGGLRYLATGNIGIARRSAAERGILMTRNAPHLVRAMPQLVPLLPSMNLTTRALVRTGFAAGDALRRLVGTPASTLPRSRRVGPDRATELVPAVRREGLEGAFLAYDGQLVDDARLVIAIARTAAQNGAKILTYVGASEVSGSSARLTDMRGGESFDVKARAVINATGVWAGDIDPALRLRPSRGTHLVFAAEALGNPTAALTVPIPGEVNRFVFAMPVQLGRIYLGLTDEDAPGPVPDVPHASPGEIDFLLDTVNTALAIRLTHADVVGSYAGLRPLIEPGEGRRAGPGDESRTADISRDHAVIESGSGVFSIIGGKLTEYRYMAQDVLDRAVAARGLSVGPCRTRDLPLIGAPANPASPPALPRVESSSLVARYGAEAGAVISSAACGRPTDPVAEGIDVIRAEFAYAISHEGALTADDILDRRTRIGLVAADRERAATSAAEFAGT